MHKISTGERPFIDILQDRRYWVIHLITIASLFLAGVIFILSGFVYKLFRLGNFNQYFQTEVLKNRDISLINDRFSILNEIEDLWRESQISPAGHNGWRNLVSNIWCNYRAHVGPYQGAVCHIFHLNKEKLAVFFFLRENSSFSPFFLIFKRKMGWARTPTFWGASGAHDTHTPRAERRWGGRDIKKRTFSTIQY